MKISVSTVNQPFFLPISHHVGRWRRLVVAVLGVICVILLAGAFWLNQAVFAPPRRALHPHQQQLLQNPSAVGLRIQAYSCLQGQAPCLVVEPDPRSPLSAKGQLVRQQVREQGGAALLAPYGDIQGTVVLLHGRNSRKEGLLVVTERFTALGLRCVLIDLPGHGKNPIAATAFGASRWESELPRRVLLELREQLQWPESPNYLWGLSMGGAFAVSAARESADFWQAVIVVSSFADLRQVMTDTLPSRGRPWARFAYPWMDLAQWLRWRPAIHAIQPAQWARQVTIPSLIVHGDADRYVSFAQGQQLYQALASPKKQFLRVVGGGHNTVLATPMPLYAAMGIWFLEAGQSSGKK